MPDPLNPMGSPAADPAAATGGDPAETIVSAITDKVISLVKDKTMTAQEKKAAFGDLMKKLEKALGIFEETPKPDAAPAADAAPFAASRAAAPDPFVVKLARENYTGKLDGLVAAGKITPAVRDDLVSQHLADAPLTLALSQKSTSQIDGLISALSKNASVVPAGERTGPQALALARSTPTGEDLKKNRTEAGKELATMTARAAGLPLPK